MDDLDATDLSDRDEGWRRLSARDRDAPRSLTSRDVRTPSSGCPFSGAKRFCAQGFRTLPVLQRDARIVTGASGARMPSRGTRCSTGWPTSRGEGTRSRYFMFLNADIEGDRRRGRVDRGDRPRRARVCFAAGGDLDPAVSGTFAGSDDHDSESTPSAFDLRSWWTRSLRHRCLSGLSYVAGRCRSLGANV